MDLRERQAPLKERYRTEPDAARIMLTARGAEGDAPVACSVDVGRAIQQAEAHVGVGDPGADPGADRQVGAPLHGSPDPSGPASGRSVGRLTAPAQIGRLALAPNGEAAL